MPLVGAVESTVSVYATAGFTVTCPVPLALLYDGELVESGV
jgi:hypothetical protein